MVSNLKRVAILGGSFDPPTVSHLQVAAEAYNKLNFDEVWIIPCGYRPDKTHISAPELRMQMVDMAVKDFFASNPTIKTNSIEIENGQSIPTYFLMEQLREKYQQTHKFTFMMGSDLLDSLHLWDEGQKLITETNFVIFERKGFQTQTKIEEHVNFPKSNPTIVPADDSIIGMISSTEVRKRVKEHTSIDDLEKEGIARNLGIAGLVTPSVLAFIKDKRLYFGTT